MPVHCQRKLFLNQQIGFLNKDQDCASPLPKEIVFNITTVFFCFLNNDQDRASPVPNVLLLIYIFFNSEPKTKTVPVHVKESEANKNEIK